MYRTSTLLIKTLLKKKLTLALVESMTCGLAAHQLSTCKGTSEVLKGSVVCYSEEVKKNMFEIPQTMIDKYSCESKQVTEVLAENLASFIKADIYAAITGLASRGGSETKSKPVGTVFFCIKYRSRIYNEKKVFRGSPLQIRQKACYNLYRSILQKV